MQKTGSSSPEDTQHREQKYITLALTWLLIQVIYTDVRVCINIQHYSPKKVIQVLSDINVSISIFKDPLRGHQLCEMLYPIHDCESQKVVTENMNGFCPSNGHQ